MRNLVTVLFAGALAATVAFAQGNTNWANDLNRAKLGRDLPYVAQTHKATQCECGMPGCAMAKAIQKEAAVVAHNDAAERAFLKTGRAFVPAVEQPAIANAAPAHNDAAERAYFKTGRGTAAAQAEPALVASKDNSMCVAMGCCKAHSD